MKSSVLPLSSSEFADRDGHKHIQKCPVTNEQYFFFCQMYRKKYKILYEKLYLVQIQVPCHLKIQNYIAYKLILSQFRHLVASGWVQLKPPTLKR